MVERSLRVILAGLLALALIAAVPPAPTAGQARRGGQVTVGLHQEPDRLWIPFSGLTVAHETSLLLNDGLLRINEKLEYFPALAMEVPTIRNGGISADGLTVTFKLRRGVKWHDGAPFTSKDVRFTYEMLVHPEVPVRVRVGWNQVDRVELPDDYTVVFRFKTVHAPFLERASTATILPQHILGTVPPREIANHPWFRTNRPGLGPFRFVEWRPGDYLIVERNPDYYVSGQPYLDRIVLKIIPDANTLTNQLETGEVDIRFRMLNDQVPVVKKMPRVTLLTTNATSPWLIWVNNKDPRLADKRVRLALNYGVNRNALTSTLLSGFVQPAYGLIPPTSWAYTDQALKYEFNPTKARQLLDEAGYVPGPDRIRAKGEQRLTFELMNIAGELERIQILSFVQGQWKNIGVEARIRNVDVATMFGRALPRREFEMAYSYIGRLVDPADLVSLYLCPDKAAVFNPAGYCNRELDDLLLKAQATLDRATRKTLYQQALKLTTEDPAYVFLAWRADHTPINKRLQGYKPAPGYLELWNAAEWWVDR